MQSNFVQRLNPVFIVCALLIACCLSFVFTREIGRINTENTFHAVKQTLHPGMSHDQVYNLLTNLAVYEVEQWPPGRCETTGGFKQPREHVTLSTKWSWLTFSRPQLDLCFDQSKTLLWYYLYEPDF